MQANASSRILQVLRDSLAGMASVVVCSQVQLLVRAVGSSQPSSSFINSSSFLRSALTQRTARMEVERPTDPRLAVCPWSRKGLCLPLRIQQKPTLGLVSSLVSS